MEGWVNPGNVEWTLVGLAEGSVGARTIADAMERPDNFNSTLGRHARTEEPQAASTPIAAMQADKSANASPNLNCRTTRSYACKTFV